MGKELNTLQGAHGKIAVRDHILANVFKTMFGEYAAEVYKEACRTADAELEAALREAHGD